MRISIKNFQSLADVDVEVKGLTVIVGRSNLGKSAFIRAIQALLFNKRGDEFIRNGAQTARVSVDSIPTVNGDGPMVVWEKGKGVNRYQIGDQLYDKIGSGTPQFFQDWGYKDIQIDNEYLRPTVSEQHDRIFLLDRAGSFISDVLSKASRLSVLLAAVDYCSGDGKRTKSELNIRRSDLEKSTQRLNAMQPIADMFGRVQALKPKISELNQTEAQVRQLKSLLTRYHSLSTVVDLKLPVTTEVPADLGDRVIKLRSLIEQQKALGDLPTLPAHSELPFNIDEFMLKLNWLRDRVTVLTRTKNLPVLPDNLLRIEELSAKLPEWQTKAAMLRKYSSEQARLDEVVRSRTASRNSIDLELEQLNAELETIKTELGICPVCERPLELEHAHQ